jgi:two-component system sensor histidine kinase RegB
MVTGTPQAPTPPRSPELEAEARIGPAAWITVRWSLVVVACGLVVAHSVRPGLWGGLALGAPWPQLGVVALWCALNLSASTGTRRSTPADAARRAGRDLLYDVALLTALLALTGGANNPFTMLYFVPITLATLVSRSWTSLVALSSVCGFAVLVAVSTWTMSLSGVAEDVVQDATHHAHHAHHAAQHGHAAAQHGDLGHFWRHLVGMGVALAVAGSLVTYFVHKIAGVLTTQRQELERLRRQAREDRYAASLGALSAGAAHELGTPLGTIQLLAGELEWMDEQERRDAAALMRQELERCKDILHGMKSPELSARALEAAGPWRVRELAEEIGAWGLTAGARLEIVCTEEDGDVSCRQPRAVLQQIVRELVTNAQRAAVGDRILHVGVELAASDDELRVRVRDDGCGMNERELASAFEPLFSTRAGGRGLGLFLARLHARQLGGSLGLASQPARGTVAELRLPLTPPVFVVDGPGEHDTGAHGARGEVST